MVLQESTASGRIWLQPFVIADFVTRRETRRMQAAVKPLTPADRRQYEAKIASPAPLTDAFTGAPETRQQSVRKRSVYKNT
jgi:hypothetical protein